MTIKGLLLFTCAAWIAFAQSTPGADSLPLMPWPASVTAGPGAPLPLNISFTVAIAGDGAKDERIRPAVERFCNRLARQTAVPVAPQITGGDTKRKEGAARNTSDAAPTLTIVVESRDHKAPQRLGDEESYSLNVSGTGIRLSADRPLGVLRGLETLLQLAGQNKATNGSGTPGFSFPPVLVRDTPRFPWRGLSLDVSRHFISLDHVKRTLDGLAAVKLNVFHWHLSDDQGFRIESKKFPQLQLQGSDGMFYTQAEVRDVIAYARERGIRIVPEFDMPGHAASWLPGYPKLGVDPKTQYEIVRGAGVFSHLLDPTKESTYRFLDGFIGEMAKLFPDEYFHIGGDEVSPKEWNTSPSVRRFMKKHNLADGKALQGYFNQRLLKIVTKHHKHMEGWDEILQPSLPKSILVQSWRGQPSLWQGARNGFGGILSAGYYLNLMYPASYHYAIDPLKAPPPEPGRENREEAEEAQGKPKPGTPADLSPDQAKLILGGEAACWEELITNENLDAKLWPRLAAIAERFWSAEQVTDTQSMYRRLAFTNHWLEWLGLQQRSNLELMRQRLAAGSPHEPLDQFSEVVESVKGYSRHAERYSILSSFNRLVDSIPPESNEAREFRDAVSQYLTLPKDQRNSQPLRDKLSRWAQAADKVSAMGQTNSLLIEAIPLAGAVRDLCQIGNEALLQLDGGKTPLPSSWRDHATQIASQYDNKRVGDLLIQIAPAIHQLIDAVPGQPAGAPGS